MEDTSNDVTNSVVIIDTTPEEKKVMTTLVSLTNTIEDVELDIVIALIQSVLTLKREEQLDILCVFSESPIKLQSQLVSVKQWNSIVKAFDYDLTTIDHYESIYSFYAYALLTLKLLTTNNSEIFIFSMESKLPHKLLLLLLNLPVILEIEDKIFESCASILCTLASSDMCGVILASTEYGWINSLLVLLNAETVGIVLKTKLIDIVHILAKLPSNKSVLIKSENGLISWTMKILENHTDSMQSFRGKVLTIVWELADVVENKIYFASDTLGLVQLLMKLLKDQKEAAEILIQVMAILWYLSRCKENMLTIFDENHSSGLYTLLLQVIQQSFPEEGIAHALTCLWNIAYYTPGKQCLVEQIPMFLQLINNRKNSPKIRLNALSILWNMATEKENQVRFINKELGVLQMLKNIIFESPEDTTPTFNMSDSYYILRVRGLDTIRKLSNQRDNKIKFGKDEEGILTLLVDCIRKDNRELRSKALGTLWDMAYGSISNQLSFVRDEVGLLSLLKAVIMEDYIPLTENEAVEEQRKEVVKQCAEAKMKAFGVIWNISAVAENKLFFVHDKNFFQHVVKILTTDEFSICWNNLLGFLKSCLEHEEFKVSCLQNNLGLVDALVNVLRNSKKVSIKVKTQASFCLMMIGEILNFRVLLQCKEVIDCRKLLMMVVEELNVGMDGPEAIVQQVLEATHILSCSKIIPEIVTVITSPFTDLFKKCVATFKASKKLSTRRTISGCFWNATEDAPNNAVLENMSLAGVYDSAVNFIFSAGNNISQWDKTTDNCLTCLMNFFRKIIRTSPDEISFSFETSDELLNFSQQILLSLPPAVCNNTLTTAEDSKQVSKKHSGRQIKLACLYVFLFKYVNQDSKAGLDDLNKSIFDAFLPDFALILQKMLESRNGPDFLLGSFALPLMLDLYLALIQFLPVHFVPLLIENDILSFCIRVAALFDRNAPHIRLCGGGGKDLESAKLVIEVLRALLLTDKTLLPKQKEKIDFSSLTDMMFNLSNNHKLSIDSRAVAKLIAEELFAFLNSTTVENNSPVQKRDLRKHVMLSYCWNSTANPDYVKELAAELRKLGIDIWRDEDGSSLVPLMGGSIDERVAEAIQHSDTVIICVSSAYKESANCKLECNYASVMAKRGQVKLLFVMMNEDYTTVSFPKYVDGWLGIVVGTSLWIAMWKKDMISSVALSIAEQVGNNVFLVKNGNSIENVSKLSVNMTSSPDRTPREAANVQPIHELDQKDIVTTINPIAILAQTNHSTDTSKKLTPLEAAWDILQRAMERHNIAGLKQYLQDVGIDKMDDLEFCDEDICIQLCKYLKIVQQKAFLVYMARFRQGVSN